MEISCNNNARIPEILRRTLLNNSNACSILEQFTKTVAVERIRLLLKNIKELFFLHDNLIENITSFICTLFLFILYFYIS